MGRDAGVAFRIRTGTNPQASGLRHDTVGCSGLSRRHRSMRYSYRRPHNQAANELHHNRDCSFWQRLALNDTDPHSAVRMTKDVAREDRARATWYPALGAGQNLGGADWRLLPGSQTG